MLIHGYLNFFEGDCCFIGDAANGVFRQLRPGDAVWSDDRAQRWTVRCADGWALSGAETPPRLQGLPVWMEDC